MMKTRKIRWIFQTVLFGVGRMGGFLFLMAEVGLEECQIECPQNSSRKPCRLTKSERIRSTSTVPSLTDASGHHESGYSAKLTGGTIVRYGRHTGNNAKPREPDPLISGPGSDEKQEDFPCYLQNMEISGKISNRKKRTKISRFFR